MFRNNNPTNLLLNGSLCFFKMDGVQAVSDFTSLPIYKELIQHQGTFNKSCEHNFELTIPHHNSDAFGGVFVMNQLVRNLATPTDSTQEFQEGLISYQGNRFRYFSWSKEFSKKPFEDKTFLQRFLIHFLNLSFVKNFERVALPVCLDDLKELSSATVWGNSLSILTFKVSELLELAFADKKTWRELIQEKALRVTAFLKRRPHTGPLKNTLLISSLGHLDHYSWANKIDARFLTMIPTPMSLDSVNLVIWATGDTQKLSFVATENHWIWSESESIEKIWSEVLS